MEPSCLADPGMFLSTSSVLPSPPVIKHGLLEDGSFVKVVFLAMNLHSVRGFSEGHVDDRRVCIVNVERRIYSG